MSGQLGFDYENALEVSTLFTQMMLDRGILASVSCYPSLAHTEQHVSRYLEAVDEAFELCAEAIENGQVQSLLRGPRGAKPQRGYPARCERRPGL